MALDLDFLSPEDMPNEQLRLVAKVIGVEATVKLLDAMSSQVVYFPQHWRVGLIEKYVASGKWDGTSGKSIAGALGVSPTSVYRVLRRKATIKPPPTTASKGRNEQVSLDL